MFPRVPLCLLGLGLLALVSTPALAQTSLMYGQGVRIVYHDDPHNPASESHKEGFLESQDGDTLRISLPSSSSLLAIPKNSISSLWALDGEKRDTWKGIGIGLLGGAVIGGLIGATQKDEWVPEAPILAGVILGAPAGALVGGIIGHSFHSDRWVRIPVQSLQADLDLRSDSFALRLSFGF